VDRWFLVSNSFSTHESVSKLARNEERAAVMLLQTGYVDVTERKDKWKGNTTVRSLSGTCIDTNHNFAMDKGEESKTFSIGAAATMNIPAEKSGEEKEARLLVLGDANAISDGILRNRGNAIFALDSIRWLAGQSDFSG